MEGGFYNHLILTLMKVNLTSGLLSKSLFTVEVSLMSSL